MLKVQPEAPTATSPLGDQRDPLTPEMVCNLPMDDLLAQVNGSLDTIDVHSGRFDGIDTSRFFGYAVHRQSGVTVYTAADATDEARDVYIRYLITQYLGLPTHLFPDIFEVTIFAGPNLAEVQA
ncbi:hypothetical protein ACFW88_00215 [Streptomyces anandii]|uniref:Uncharacterized protein n=1 Tax=Streptomyces anandii TaxID=285454 RepID=A0ABW6GX78_9ACTN